MPNLISFPKPDWLRPATAAATRHFTPSPVKRLCERCSSCRSIRLEVPHLSGRQLPTTSQLLEGSRVATCSTMMNVQKEIPNSGFLWIPKIAHFPASKKKSAVSPGVSDLKLKPLVDSIWFLPLAYTVIVIFHQPQYCRNVSRIPVISSRFNNKKPFGIISFFRIFEITTIWQLPRKA